MSFLKKLKGKIDWDKTAPSLILVFNSFTWYIFAYAVFSTTVNALSVAFTEKLGLFITYFVGVAVSAILGSKLLPSVRRRSLQLWPFVGAIATLLVASISSNSMVINAAIALFLGASIGVGLPSCLSQFADSAPVGNRGFAAGTVWSGVGFTVLLFAYLYSLLGVSLWMVIALTVWRILGGVGFLVLETKPEETVMRRSPSYLELIRKREILLYLFPWVMFSVINFVESPILATVFPPEEFALVQILEYAIVGIVAVVGGIIADVVGRKRVIIVGFVMLGITYALMSVFFLFSSSLYIMYLFLVLDGITWGLLATIFMTVLWGDLGENLEKEKYYALGGLPFLLAGIFSILIQPFALSIPRWGAFSLASFFLFSAVIPLMFAPETLPAKTIRDKALKSYLEKAQKVKERYV